MAASAASVSSNIRRVLDVTARSRPEGPSGVCGASEMCVYEMYIRICECVTVCGHVMWCICV